MKTRVLWLKEPLRGLSQLGYSKKKKKKKKGNDFSVIKGRSSPLGRGLVRHHMTDHVSFGSWKQIRVKACLHACSLWAQVCVRLLQIESASYRSGCWFYREVQHCMCSCKLYTRIRFPMLLNFKYKAFVSGIDINTKAPKHKSLKGWERKQILHYTSNTSKEATDLNELCITILQLTQTALKILVNIVGDVIQGKVPCSSVGHCIEHSVLPFS